jgi:hypothetical protein
LAVSAFGVVLAVAGLAAAQQRPALVINRPAATVARGNNLYCAGYVQTAPIDTSNRIMGAYNEQDGWMYAQHNDMYINVGANKGVNVGDMFSVVRPRGRVNTRWTKKGDLGFYVQEVGALEVIRVKGDYAVARVRSSCENFLLGDLIQPMQPRVAPASVNRPPLDRFADPNGKATGRLFMARDGREALATELIVYVDLGAEDNVQIGDYMTVFRPLGKGNPFINDEDESIEARNKDFGSSEYRGNIFSNQAPRKSGDHAGGRIVTTEKAKEDRPFIRKVVGEGVVLNVRERTATVLLTRNAQEIHTGDWVEVQ